MPRWFSGEVRREFLNRRLGRLRKLLRVARLPSDYRVRRLAAQALRPAFGRHEVETLVREGWAPLQLPPELLAALRLAAEQRLLDRRALPGRVQEGKDFYRDLLDETAFAPDGPWLGFALDERLLSLVAQYFGAAPCLQSVELIRSQPARPGSPLFRSQLWHCDNNNDTRMVKLFVYLTDVGPEHGPLSFLPEHATARVPWSAGHYLDDRTIARYAQLDQTVRLLGEAGTAILLDTARLFHFGSRCERPRITFVAHYNTGFGFLPRSNLGRKWSIDSTQLTTLQRLALGFPH